MNDQQLLDALGSVSQRYRRIIVGTAMAGTWGIAALGGVALRQWLHGADYQVPLCSRLLRRNGPGPLTPVLIFRSGAKRAIPVWLVHKIEKTISLNSIPVCSLPSNNPTRATMQRGLPPAHGDQSWADLPLPRAPAGISSSPTTASVLGSASPASP